MDTMTHRIDDLEKHISELMSANQIDANKEN